MITHTLLAAILLTSSPAPPDDPWFGEDKLQHFFASFAVSSLSAGAARAAGLDHSQSIYLGAGFGVGSGIAKEIHDARSGQFFSVRDLLWDLAGIGLAVVMLDATR